MRTLAVLMICVIFLSACADRKAERSPLEAFFMNALQIVYDSVKPEHQDGN